MLQQSTIEKVAHGPVQSLDHKLVTAKFGILEEKLRTITNERKGEIGEGQSVLTQAGCGNLQTGKYRRFQHNKESAKRFHIHILGPEWLSRYSDSLRTGRSGDQVPVGGGKNFLTCPDRPPPL